MWREVQGKERALDDVAECLGGAPNHPRFWATPIRPANATRSVAEFGFRGGLSLGRQAGTMIRRFVILTGNIRAGRRSHSACACVARPVAHASGKGGTPQADKAPTDAYWGDWRPWSRRSPPHHCDHERPHGSLGYSTHAERAKQAVPFYSLSNWACFRGRVKYNEAGSAGASPPPEP